MPVSLEGVLDGVRVVSLAMHIPGPLAVARLHALGAGVVKMESPHGDPLAASAPEWYAQLCRDQTVISLDLKSPDDRALLERHLDGADLLVTTMRGRALARLGLDWEKLHARFAQLSHVAIFGERPPRDDRAGHDLTYQAQAGLLAPPSMPRTVAADLAAAERAVSAALGLLLLRERFGRSARADISIVDAARDLALPLVYGLTSSDGPLGGVLPTYNIYRSSDGWIALAVLEEHFQRRLAELLQCDVMNADALRERFSTQTSAQWEALAAQHDIPLASLR